MAPVFKVRSSEAVSAFLDAGIDELLLTRNADGAPLLHVCIMRKILTSDIASKLASQVNNKKCTGILCRNLYWRTRTCKIVSSLAANGVACCRWIWP